MVDTCTLFYILFLPGIDIEVRVFQNAPMSGVVRTAKIFGPLMIAVQGDTLKKYENLVI